MTQSPKEIMYLATSVTKHIEDPRVENRWKQLGSSHSHPHSEKTCWAPWTPTLIFLDPSENWGHRRSGAPKNQRAKQIPTTTAYGKLKPVTGAGIFWNTFNHMRWFLEAQCHFAWEIKNSKASKSWKSPHTFVSFTSRSPSRFSVWGEKKNPLCLQQGEGKITILK